ncbi:MAG: DNA polymerase III subunit chi [Janthinobacterium lividum]
MTAIGFYHLTRTGADRALPLLLGRTLAAGARAVVMCGDAARVAAMDDALWLSPDPDWLPHGSARGAGLAGDPALQPIWVTERDEAPNGARYLFLLDAARSARLGEFERVFDLFDGADEAAVAAARVRWAEAKAAGHDLAYWQQGERGWERKA